MNYYFNEETIEYFHNRSYLVEDPDMLYDEMWNFVNVDYEIGDNESVDEAVKSLIEVVTSHRNM